MFFCLLTLPACGHFDEKSLFLSCLPAPDVQQTWQQCSQKNLAYIIFHKSSFTWPINTVEKLVYSLKAAPTCKLEIGHVIWTCRCVSWPQRTEHEDRCELVYLILRSVNSLVLSVVSLGFALIHLWNSSNHFQLVGNSQDGGGCWALYSKSMESKTSGIITKVLLWPALQWHHEQWCQQWVDIFEPCFTESLTCNRTIPERWRGPTLSSYLSRSSATLPPLWYHEHQTSGSTLCMLPQVHLQSPGYQTVNNKFSVLRPSRCCDHSLWHWLACVQFLHRGGSVFTGLRLFVGWFVNRITQKLLKRFPEDG